MSFASRAIVLAALPLFALSSAPVFAQQSKSLDDLLKRVKQGYAAERATIKKREAEFKSARDRQATLLAAAERELKAAEQLSVDLETQFQANELRLTELETTLRTRLGTMGELFGVVRQVAGDTAAQIDASLVSSQIPNRKPKVEALAQSESLPSIAELEHLWYALQQEMTESGKVARYKTMVSDTDGQRRERDVVRVGAFNVISDGNYLQYLTDVSTLATLPRQPPGRFLSSASALENSQSGFTRFALDPSRGAILGLLIEAPSVEERIALGGTIGYIVIGLGIFAFLVGVIRLVGLSLANMKIGSQLKSKEARGDNAVGRMLQVYEANKSIPAEDLERKLDEVIVRESAAFERFLWIVKVVAVAAPLMGLLGTVTGMIRTFQAITLFGTGDPKLMAGGISEALVTTMLGLVVAIPLVLFHAVLSNLSRRMVDIVEEQAAGVVARRAEAEHRDG